MLLALFHFYEGNFIVGFLETTYTVTEGDDGQRPLNVCVTLISPKGDIRSKRILVEVFRNTNRSSIPPGSALAS